MKIAQSKQIILSIWLLLVTFYSLPISGQIPQETIDSIRIRVDEVHKLIQPIQKKLHYEHKHYTDQGIYRKKGYNRLMEEKFTFLTFQRGALPVGNSASLDLSENSTQLKLGLSRRITNDSGKVTKIISLGVQSKLGDGVSNVLSGDIPSSGTTFYGNISLLENAPALKNIFHTFENGKQTSKSIPFDYIRHRSEQLNNLFKLRNVVDYPTKYKALLCRLDEIRETLRNCKDCKVASELILERSAIERELEASGLLTKEAKDITDAMVDEYEDQYYGIITEKPIWEWFRLRWFDIGFTYNRLSYNTYNALFKLDKRFDTKDYDTWGLKFTQNWYKERVREGGKVRTTYFNISYEAKMTNSFATLNDVSIVKNLQVAASGDTTYIFQTTKTAKDISGIEFTTAWQHSISGNLTLMFTQQRNIGLNLFFQGQYSKISYPIYNSKVGLLIAVANNNYDTTDKQSKAKVNFELFVQFADMTDVAKSERTVWRNRVLGISTNIPFSKILFK